MVKVNFYSGYKGEERPSSFEENGNMHIIAEVTETKIVEDFHTKKRKRIYVVKTDGEEIYELAENGEWNLKKLPDSHFA